jgi:hypothetical protein
MADVGVLSNVKNATVAVGLTKLGNPFPFIISGSGFILSSKRYAVTALHVVQNCWRMYNLYQQKGVRVEPSIFHVDITNESRVALDTIPFALPYQKNVIDVRVIETDGTFPGSLDLDVCIIRLVENDLKLPYLEFRKSEKFELYSEITMCGYPSGDQSLNPIERNRGIRFSPIMQFGRVAGFMPTDHSCQPVGIQTDIIGTGGSSGSPIVDQNGEVIAIAQKVITSAVHTNKKDVFDEAKIGLVYGVSYHQIHFVPDTATKRFETGKPIPFETKSTVLTGPKIQIGPPKMAPTTDSEQTRPPGRNSKS